MAWDERAHALFKHLHVGGAPRVHSLLLRPRGAKASRLESARTLSKKGEAEEPQ
jgi:hypothetical protein